jgi:hypothetical protein
MCALPCSETSDMHPSTVFAFERPTKLCTFDSPSLLGASCRETDEGIFDLVSLSLLPRPSSLCWLFCRSLCSALLLGLTRRGSQRLVLSRRSHSTTLPSTTSTLARPTVSNSSSCTRSQLMACYSPYGSLDLPLARPARSKRLPHSLSPSQPIQPQLQDPFLDLPHFEGARHQRRSRLAVLERWDSRCEWTE